MYCTKCGSQLPEGVSFCSQCGAKVTNNSSEQPSYKLDDTSFTNLMQCNVNFIRIIASAIIILSTFMPYVSSFGFEKSLLAGGDGILFIGLAVIAIICDSKRKYTPAFVVSIMTLTLTIYEIIDTANIASKAFGLINYEVGYFFLVIGAIGMVTAGPIMKAIKRK